MPTVNISATLEAEDNEALRRATKARQESISTFVRRALRKELIRLGYLESLTDEDRQALEIPIPAQ